MTDLALDETIGKIAQATREDLELAVKAAEKGFTLWREVSALERSKVMRKALSQTHTRDVIDMDLGRSDGEDFELFGERGPGSVGIPGLSLAHDVDHLDAGQNDGGARLQLEAEH